MAQQRRQFIAVDALDTLLNLSARWLKSLAARMNFPLLNRLVTTAVDKAAIDDLTGLTSRPAFNTLFRQTVKSSRRANRRVSLALFGIDELKQVNAKRGYAVGDQTVKAVAAVVEAHSMPNDIVCRWTGEQFMLLLQDCGLDKAMAIADAIRKDIEQLTIPVGLQPAATTVSAGVAEVKAVEGEESAFARAVDGLTAAKHAGHNCVISTNRF